MPRKPAILKSQEEKEQDEQDEAANDAGSDEPQDDDATKSDGPVADTMSRGRRSPTRAPDSPGDVPQTDDAEGVFRHRDAISHNMLGTPQDPVDPISHNPIGPPDAYEGDDDLNVGSILEDEADLKAQLHALPTERLLILSHAVTAESASR